MRRVNETLLNAVSDTASHSSAAVDANQLVSASFHIYFADATAVGTFKIQE